MPKVQLSFQGQQNQFVMTADQARKDYVVAQVAKLWGLNDSQYSVTYLDSDKDQITADTEDDYQVARETMDNIGQGLVFNIHVKQGVQPKVGGNIQNKEESLVKSKEQVIAPSVEENKVQQVSINVEQPEQQKQLEVIELKVQQPKQNVMSQASTQMLNNNKQIQQEKDKKRKLMQQFKLKQKAEKQAQRKAMAEAAKEAQRLERQKKAIEAEQRKKQKQDAKAEAEKSKKEVKQAKQKKNQQKKQKAQKQAQKQKKTQEKAQAIQNKHHSSSEQGSIPKNITMNQQQLKMLIRSQVLSMIPQIKQKISQNKMIPEPIKINQIKHISNQLNICSQCKNQLIAPFYYSIQTKHYLCSKCQNLDTLDTPLIKIRNQNHFETDFYIYGGVVKYEQIKQNQDSTFDQFIQVAKAMAVGKIKEDLKRKSNEQKKKKIQQEEKKVKAVKMNKQEEEKY